MVKNCETYLYSAAKIFPFCSRQNFKHVMLWSADYILLSPPVQPVCLWLDQNYRTIINISKSIAPRVLKFGQGMGVGDPEVDLEGQGHRSKVKVTRSKKCFLVSIYIFIGQCIKVKVTWVEVKGHLGQGQRSLGSTSVKHSWYWQVGSHQRQVAFFRVHSYRYICVSALRFDLYTKICDLCSFFLFAGT